MSKSRNQLALEIQQGACNPYPVTAALLDAIKDAGGGQQALDDPACRLIAHQLAHLFGTHRLNAGTHDYSKALEACEQPLPPMKRTNNYGSALEAIQRLLSGQVWDSDTPAAIAEVMTRHGFEIAPVEDEDEVDFKHYGSVIHGTHRPQDLIPAFMITLSQLDEPTYQALRRKVGGAYTEALEDEGHPWWASPLAIETLHGLEDLLCDYAPAGYYFGAHPGDGSDFGFWGFWD